MADPRLRAPLSVTIIALNEEKKIAHAIQSVRWADEVCVVDSGSQDRTIEIARGLGARVISQPWLGYGQQKNFAQDQAHYDWILNLDADEVVSQQLEREIKLALEDVAQDRTRARGFSFPRKTTYLGRWVQHGGWYPNSLVRLADRRHARWSEPEVHEALQVKGLVLPLEAPLVHHAFDSIADQIRTNLRFAELGSKELRRRGQQPSLLKLVLKPIGKFLETYVIKKGFLDGVAGFIISINAAHSLFMKYSFLFEDQIRNHEHPDSR